ncbi:MAG: hypothetical protein PF590_00055 [Candidatus Delongbacteria bacterium]|jgi:hypothetical protein|nr:hypothetical protein [Candidatus Delongbacteria bacterium]
MKKITQFILIISVLAALIACKKLPVYESEYAEKPDDIIQSDKELPYSHYDPDSKIRYDVFHNDSMLFLYFDVSDQSSIFKIFAHGLEVYIDKEGKRKKTQGFIYPIQGAVQQRSVMPPQGTTPNLPDKNNLNEIQKNISSTFTLIQDDEEENFNLFALHNDLDISMDFENDNLKYKASIPINMFGMDSLPETLTIGILSGEMPGPEKDDNQNVNMQNQNYNNPITQGSPISGNRPMNNNSPNQRNMNQTQEPIRIWFKIKPVGGN